MAPPTPPQTPQEPSEARESLLHTIAELVFLYLPLSAQAITLPALSKGWQQWAREREAKERALQQAERVSIGLWPSFLSFWVPLWAAQQRQQAQQLSDEQKRRFQLRAVAHGDVCAVDCFGIGSQKRQHRIL